MTYLQWLWRQWCLRQRHALRDPHDVVTNRRLVEAIDRHYDAKPAVMRFPNPFRKTPVAVRPPAARDIVFYLDGSTEVRNHGTVIWRGDREDLFDILFGALP
jgi:hypothetical protein